MRKFEQIRGNAVMPERKTAGSAGYDFCVPKPISKRHWAKGKHWGEEEPQPESIHIAPGKTAVIKTGIRAQMPSNEVLLLFIRSSLGMKKGLRLCNSVGVIDSDYYDNPDNGGEIMAALHNTSDEPVELFPGDAFMQGVFVRYGVVDDDIASGKRVGGIGSTGR